MVKALGIQNNVQFLGFLNHDDALKEIASAGVGLALYNGTWGFNFYGDSMKCREFMCFGLPVLTTDTHSTVEEIKSHEVGIVCEMTAQAYVTALKQIFSNYAKFESNSYKLSRLYEGIHEKLLTEVINISK